MAVTRLPAAFRVHFNFITCQQKTGKNTWKEKSCRINGLTWEFAAGAEKTNVIHHTD